MDDCLMREIFGRLSTLECHLHRLRRLIRELSRGKGVERWSSLWNRGKRPYLRQWFRPCGLERFPKSADCTMCVGARAAVARE